MVVWLVKEVSGAYNAAHFERETRSCVDRMGDQGRTKGQELEIDRYRVQQEPYYAEVNGEMHVPHGSDWLSIREAGMKPGSTPSPTGVPRKPVGQG